MSHSRWKRNCREGTGRAEFGLALFERQKMLNHASSVDAQFEKDVHFVLVRDDVGCGRSTVSCLIEVAPFAILEVVFRSLECLIVDRFEALYTLLPAIFS
jgi:hypothetical protein